MNHQVVCPCGNVIQVAAGTVGSGITCPCGCEVSVPPLSVLKGAADEDGGVPFSPDLASITEPRPADGWPTEFDPPRLVVPPTPVTLRVWQGGRRGRKTSVTAALTSDALVIQDAWRLRLIPLGDVRIEGRRGNDVLTVTPGPDAAAERLLLSFAGRDDAERWARGVRSAQEVLNDSAQPAARLPADGVSLVRKAGEVPRVDLGRIEFTGPNRKAADRGLQLYAGLRGADAVVEVDRQRCPEREWGARCVSGLAVRVEDVAGRDRLRFKYFAEEVASWSRRAVVVLLLLLAATFLIATRGPNGVGLEQATGETKSELVVSAAMGVAMVCGWPLALLALLRVLRWPQLLKPAGLALVVATTGRGLVVIQAHVLAALTTGVTLAESRLGYLADPGDWFFIVAGLVLSRRAWRLARDARQILPEDAQTVSGARKGWSLSLLAVTGLYALVVLGTGAVARYEASAHLLQPGVNPRIENEALLALNEGVMHSQKGDADAAERSFRKSLLLWEQLTAGKGAPRIYTENLVVTLYDLSLLSGRRGRADEEEALLARAVALADGLGDEDASPQEFKESVAYARQALAELRSGKAWKLLEEKEAAAARKYEEARVLDDEADPRAEPLYREAIAAFEELLTQATDPKYRKLGVERLATAYLLLGQHQLQQPDESLRSAAAETLKKGIGYSERAVAESPDRPLLKHNLKTARRMLDGLHEEALEREVESLLKQKRHADAVALWTRGVEEQEEKSRTGKDPVQALASLAYRLDRLAWLLAHCPERGGRDTKAAVAKARRATELRPDVGSYWRTLALVQYRNADLAECLATLDRTKGEAGELDATGWFVSAMAMHRLGRKDDARAAFGKAVEWLKAALHQAEDDALLRFEFELMRPALEALHREAEAVLEGRDPALRELSLDTGTGVNRT